MLEKGLVEIRSACKKRVPTFFVVAHSIFSLQGPHFDGTISVPKKNSVLGQYSHTSRKFFLGIEDGLLEEMEGTEYIIRPGLSREPEHA